MIHLAPLPLVDCYAVIDSDDGVIGTISHGIPCAALLTYFSAAPVGYLSALISDLLATV